MGTNLGPLNIKDSYQGLVQTSGSVFTDGTGSVITGVDISASFATTASYALNAETVDTGSLLVTSSISDATITFTKGDATSYNLVVDNVANADTATSSSHALIADNGGVTSIIAGTNISIDQGTGDVTISAVGAGTINTGSLLADASVTEGVLTFERGDQTTFDLQVNNVVNADSASYVPGAGVDGTVATATSASQAENAVNADSAASATTAISASYILGSNVEGAVDTATSASYILGANVDGTVATATSASHALIANIADFATTATTASYVEAANIDGTVATATTASHALVADSVLGSIESAVSASYILGSGVDGAVASATDATNADNIAITQDASNSDRFVTFTATSAGDGTILTDDGIKYNPFANKLTTTGDLAIGGIADVSASIAEAAEGSGLDTGSFVKNDEDTYTSVAKVEQVVTLTGTEYNALTPDDNTLYLINDSTGSLVVSASHALVADSLSGAVENATSASYVAKGVETGSVSGNVLTFTTFDESEFSLTVDTGSGGGAVDVDVLNWTASNASGTDYRINVFDTVPWTGQDGVPTSGSTAAFRFITKENIALGLNAFGANNLNTSDSQGIGNIGIGRSALKDITTGKQNISIGGVGADGNGNLWNLTSGNSNIGIGCGVGAANFTTGNENVLIGQDVGLASFNGSQNVIIGAQAMRDGSGGTGRVGIGRWNSYSAGGGNYGIAIGHRAGWKDKGSYNIFIGENVVGQTSGDFSTNYGIAIGSNVTAADNLMYGYHGTDSTPGDRFLTITGLLNAPLQSTAPTGAGLATGSIYFDTSTLKLRCYDGTAWNNLF